MGRSLNDIDFCDLLNGWAVGNGRIYHTSNGGNQWIYESQYFEDYTFLCGVCAVDSTTAYVVGQSNDLGPVFLKYMQLIGVEEIPETSIEVFPNPVKDKCKMRNAKCEIVDCDIELLDLSGRKVMKVFKGRFPSKGIEFDMSHFPAGVYFCKILSSNTIVTKKIVKL